MKSAVSFIALFFDAGNGDGISSRIVGKLLPDRMMQDQRK
jgi:hypothetical protein